jgi:uncharacterized membrane protein
MPWNRWYAIRSYLRSSLWLVPLLALVVEQILLRGAIAIDNGRLDVSPTWPLSEAGTTTALQSIITLSLSFVVFAFGSILVAIQVASGQLTPRIIATTLLRDNVIRTTVGLFVFTLLFAIGAVSRMSSTPPRLVVWIATLSGFGSIAAFLYLIDHCARLLRPVSVVWLVGEQGKRVIEAVYPRRLDGEDDEYSGLPPSVADQVVMHDGASAVVIAVNLYGVVGEARRLGAIVEIVPRVGDFVGAGEPLMRVFGAVKGFDAKRLKHLVAFGPERTIEQDPTFAFRVIVDIAIKALSKAINDPTTAVLAIDQLQRLLRIVGSRNLHDNMISGGVGDAQVFLRTPDWDDFVQLSVREIRLYGAENFQVARRLRAMLLTLIEALAATRVPTLKRELELLDQAIQLAYPLDDDRALARVADTQGLGGSSGRTN